MGIQFPHIYVTVRFFSTEEGGRTGPVFGNSYKPSIQIEEKTCPGLFLLGKDLVIYPGQEVKNIPIKLLDVGYLKDKLDVGVPFKVREDKFVAEGVISRVVPPG